MKKILLSLITASVVAGSGVYATRAFFSDTETSTGNTFTAGAIDLKVSNTSYYNKTAVPGSTWTSMDLTENNKLFFNFADLKPGDLGEDTIDLLVNSNPAYACMNIKVTATPENVLTQPEIDAEDASLDKGELQDELHFTFWADDGDNVLGTDEVVKIFVDNKTIQQISDDGAITLADSTKNIWLGPTAGAPMEPNTAYYIGKVWCYGVLTQAPVANHPGDPTVDSGFLCNGQPVTNKSQTDSLTADVEFYAEQARNNSNFKCGVFDYVDIGNTTSEIGHNLLEWSDPWVQPGWGGNYGGGSSDTSLRLLMGHGDPNGCGDTARDATFTMNTGGHTATKLTLEHLDGAVNDSFEVYVNSVLAGSYTATSTGGTEVWKTTTFGFPGTTGIINVRLRATFPVTGWCLNWGQVGFSNAKLE